MIAMDPEQLPWLYRAIVMKEENTMIGHISFHHKAPDPDLFEYSSYATELGYTIEPQYRKNGFAKESAIAMLNWAKAQNVHTFILTISPDNTPSVRLAQSMGFIKIAERMDEIDGVEGVYIRHDTDLIGR